MIRYFFLLLTPSLFLEGQTAQSPLPNSELKEPEGKQVQFRFETMPTSLQIYTCREAGQGFAWVSDPNAILMKFEKTLVAHHYRGPMWEGTDGSFVRTMAHRQNTSCRRIMMQSIAWNRLPKTPRDNLGRCR